jgi:hypothetical protein
MATPPTAACNAAQSDPALAAARTAFADACGDLRADQAAAAAWAAAAAASAAIAAGFAAAGVVLLPVGPIGHAVGLVFLGLAALFLVLAGVFTALSVAAASRVSMDEGALSMAQAAWQAALSRVRRLCCPGWITISTNDLMCP